MKTSRMNTPLNIAEQTVALARVRRAGLVRAQLAELERILTQNPTIEVLQFAELVALIKDGAS